MNEAILNHKPAVIFLDVYETLLDMSGIERKVNNLFNSRRGFIIWFELMMQYCFIDNCIGQYHDFTSIAKATLKMTGKTLGQPVSEDHVDDVLHLMKHLPLHENVPEGLSMLHDKGFRIAGLTNSPLHILRDRMEGTGLISYFEKVLSAEEIKKYKPSGDVYRWAAEKMQVDPADALMVTAHGWDVAGAHYAGMMTAYIQRSNQMIYPLAPKPMLIAKDLIDLSQQLEGVKSIA